MRDRIGKYEIIGLLGRGGMGEVYKGLDPIIGREVAIKVILERALHDPSIKKRFYREAQSAGRLSHENITIIHDVGEEEGMAYIVMEYLVGEDLGTLLKAPTRLSQAQKRSIATQICKGLSYAHGHGVIHRDIKPGNIRVLSSGRVKIMDFGIARLQNQTQGLTKTNMSLGTPRYMAPEQIKGEELTPQADIFSCGVLLYELFVGNNPFDGNNVTTVIYKILNVNPHPVELATGRLSESLWRVISKCLAKDVATRYQSLEEVLKDLEAVDWPKEVSPPAVSQRGAPVSSSAAAPENKDETVFMETIMVPAVATDEIQDQDDTVERVAVGKKPPVVERSTTEPAAAVPARSAGARAKSPPRAIIEPPPRQQAMEVESVPSTREQRHLLLAGRSRWVLLGAVLVLSLTAGGYFVFGSSGEPPPAVRPDSEQRIAASTQQTALDSTVVPIASDTFAPITEPNGTEEGEDASPNTPAAGLPRDPIAPPEEEDRSGEVVSEGETDTETSATPPSDPPEVSGEDAGEASSGKADQLETVLGGLESDLKSFFEQENVNGLSAMFYRGWTDFFAKAEAVTARVQIGNAQVVGDHATVDVQVSLTYQEEGTSREDTRAATWQLDYMSGEWMLTRVVSR